MKVKVVTEKKIEVEGLVKELRDKSRIDIHGMAGAEVRVNKQMLSDAASVIETLAKAVTRLRTDEVSKEHTMCDDCCQRDCHCDCTRESKPKVREFESEADMIDYIVSALGGL